MLFFFVFSQSVVLRSSRLLDLVLLSTLDYFSGGVSSLRSHLNQYAILICFNFLCSVFSFLVISRTCGVGSAFVTYTTSG